MFVTFAASGCPPSGSRGSNQGPVHCGNGGCPEITSGASSTHTHRERIDILRRDWTRDFIIVQSAGGEMDVAMLEAARKVEAVAHLLDQDRRLELYVRWWRWGFFARGCALR